VASFHKPVPRPAGSAGGFSKLQPPNAGGVDNRDGGTRPLGSLRSALSGFESLGLDLFHQGLQRTPTDLTEVSLVIRHEAPAVADAVDLNVRPAQVAVGLAVTAIANESRFRSHNLQCSPAI
jgi:hypothetical protein